MNKPMSVLVLAIAVLSASMALAQSSGNFDAAVSPTVCTLNSSTGTLSPLCTPTVDGTECVLLDTTIKTSNGNGSTLLITPISVSKCACRLRGDTCYPTPLPMLPTRAASFTTSVSSRSVIRCLLT